MQSSELASEILNAKDLSISPENHINDLLYVGRVTLVKTGLVLTGWQKPVKTTFFLTTKSG